MQDGLFQAGYFRDAAAVQTEAYKSASEIGAWNGEGEGDGSSMESVKANFLLTTAFAMVQVTSMSTNTHHQNTSDHNGTYHPFLANHASFIP